MGEESERMVASGFFDTPDGKKIEIRDVWESNLAEEMANIMEILEEYPYVAMDTEFPGVVARPVGDYVQNDITYHTLRVNVDMLKLIQLGLSFTDGQGNWAEGCTCWQFNFKFNMEDDIHAKDSIELLKTSGIDFDKFQEKGISVPHFGELMMMSGLVLNEDVKWVSFHSGYDFGYLLKTLTCVDLPVEEMGFLEVLHTYFPCIYDVKFMMTAVEGMHGGLSALGDTLQVERIGPMHQAGSDSLLTAQTYFALIKKHLENHCDDNKFRGELFGLGNNHTKYKSRSSMYQPTSSSNGSNGNGGNYPQYGSSMNYGTLPHSTSNGNYGSSFGFVDETSQMQDTY
jgi:CCR4-NOT transcription complex subunit 7/8